MFTTKNDVESNIWIHLENEKSNIQSVIFDLTNNEPSEFSVGFIRGFMDIYSQLFYLDKHDPDSIMVFLSSIYYFHKNTTMHTKPITYKLGVDSAWNRYQIFIIFALKRMRDLEK